MFISIFMIKSKFALYILTKLPPVIYSSEIFNFVDYFFLADDSGLVIPNVSEVALSFFSVILSNNSVIWVCLLMTLVSTCFALSSGFNYFSGELDSLFEILASSERALEIMLGFFGLLSILNSVEVAYSPVLSY